MATHQTIRVLTRARDKACSLPYVAETEALEFVMRGKMGGHWWKLVSAGAREAEAMLSLAERRERR